MCHIALWYVQIVPESISQPDEERADGATFPAHFVEKNTLKKKNEKLACLPFQLLHLQNFVVYFLLLETTVFTLL